MAHLRLPLRNTSTTLLVVVKPSSCSIHPSTRDDGTAPFKVSSTLAGVAEEPDTQSLKYLIVALVMKLIIKPRFPSHYKIQYLDASMQVIFILTEA